MKKSIFNLLIGAAIITLIALGNTGSAKYAGLQGNETTLFNDMQQKKDTATIKTVYTCPMHAEVIQDKAGKCPKCGMKLDKKEVSGTVYTCPMHTEVLQDKMGKCPKCGMDLVKKTPSKK